VRPIPTKPDAAVRTGRRGRRSDFAARLKGRVRTLRARLERRQTLLDAVRDANATRDPGRLAELLVQWAQNLIPAPCWAVVAQDVTGDLRLFAHQGLTSGLGPTVWVVARWVVRRGEELLAADLATDSRGGPPAAGTVLAFPLMARARTFGALIGLDPDPSLAPPALSAPVTLAFKAVIEPVACALDTAVALQKAEELSVTDDLTRLYNSRYLHHVLHRETKRASRNGRPLSLVFLDLDGFKRVNDEHGHLVGSKALVEAAAVIRGCARETDVVARFGGDEFSVILPDTDSQGAVSVALRIRDRLRASHFLASEGLSVQLTASIGVATLPDAASSAEELLRAADAAMYKVKSVGKDGIHIAQGEELLPSASSSSYSRRSD
jgi:two-component system, cell cycle response regulator